MAYLMRTFGAVPWWHKSLIRHVLYRMLNPCIKHNLLILAQSSLVIRTAFYPATTQRLSS